MQKSILINNGKIRIASGAKVRSYDATPKNIKRVTSLNGMRQVDWGGLYRYNNIHDLKAVQNENNE
jgi:hypothetical protein